MDYNAESAKRPDAQRSGKRYLPPELAIDLEADNVILRAGYQFIAFDKLLGQQATLNVVKAGIGLKY